MIYISILDTKDCNELDATQIEEIEIGIEAVMADAGIENYDITFTE